MSQYFSENPEVASQERTIDIKFRQKVYRFITDTGVFSKARFDFGSQVMLEAVVDELQGRVLDLGCGYGPVGVLAGLHQDLELTMVDVNPRAVALARANAQAHGVKAQVLQSDGFAELGGRVFDYVLLNPPIRAGKAVIYRLFDEAQAQLAPGGSLIIVIRKRQGADSAKKKLQSNFGAVDVLDRSGGYHVIRAKKSTLSDGDTTDH